MLYASLCIVELFILFLLSRSLTRNLSAIIFRITRSKKITVYILALLFLPGTIIHELAHFLMAEMLFVRAGEIRLFPELHGHEVKLGSVAIAHTDPIRRFFIGAAPFFFGTSIILIAMITSMNFGLLQNYWLAIPAGYIIFEIGNTMFSSKKDMEGAIELILGGVVIYSILFFFHIRLETPLIALLQTKSLEPLFFAGSIMLAIPVIVDILTIAIIKLLNRSV